MECEEREREQRQTWSVRREREQRQTWSVRRERESKDRHGV